MNFSERHCGIRCDRRHFRHRSVAGVNLDQRGLAGEFQHQQGLVVAHHIGEHVRFLVYQVQHIDVMQQGAYLVAAGNQRGIITLDQLRFQSAVQGIADCRQHCE
jgi:hypothetical protein